MAQRRKLQVFVSSTFTDLKEERQAAVEAILTAGHIPAGMELFAGQNEEQMNIIQRWIDESDIYLLLLGGRYGSIENKSGKSYTHLEYDYAKSAGKVIFVVVVDDSYLEKKVNDKGTKAVMELDHRTEYLKFKEQITGKYVKHWNSIEQLQLAVINTIHVLDRDENLVGWIPGSEATDSGAIAEQLARLSKENAELREQLRTFNKPVNNSLYNGLTFDQMCSLLNQSEISEADLGETYVKVMTIVAEAFGHEKPTLLHFFYQLKLQLKDIQLISNSPVPLQLAIHKLADFNLLSFSGMGRQNFSVTQDGYLFSLRLQAEYNAVVTESFSKRYN